MPTSETAATADACSASLARGGLSSEGIAAPSARFDVVCIGADGEEKWRDHASNVVTLEGKTLNLNVFFGATAKPSNWYIILANAGTKAAADTAASHAGWTEYQNYSNATRHGLTFGAATTVSTTGAQVTNTGGTAVAASISGAGGTVAGAGVITDNTKGGTAGTLYNIADFTGGSKAVASGDTLNITITLSFAA